LAGLGHHRTDLQRLAETKLADAVLLAQARRWSNAYYLAGYTVEIGLKACIARRIRADTLPDPTLVRNVYVHDLAKLVGLAGLSGDLRQQQSADVKFAANWATVAEWDEASRYESTDSFTCQALLDAIAQPQSGVLEWLKRHW
jgi:hypothetical protein